MMAFLSPAPSVSARNSVTIHSHSNTSLTNRLRRSSFLVPISQRPNQQLSLASLLPKHHQSSPFVFRSEILATASSPTMSKPKILISGPPASGKGTQCEFIVDKYDVVHISTGDMLRAAVKEGTKLGVLAKSYMDAGDLVPDDLVISLLKERIAKQDCIERGWLLDGFPRTAIQAQALDDAGIIPSAVMLLSVDDDVLIQRVIGRRLDPETGQIYHVTFNPAKDPKIADRLIQRSDDTEEKAKVRLENYYKHSQAIQDHYSSLLKEVEGNRLKNEVFEDLKDIIDESIPPADDDDNDKTPTAGGYGSIENDIEAQSSTQGLPVSEFVRRAEEAYERGRLEDQDVNWSGQAGASSADEDGLSSYSDISKRLDLVIGDFVSLLIFAYIGRASHGDKSLDLGVLKTAAPFLAAWFLTTPLLGAYTRQATANIPATIKTFTKSWAIAIPMGIGLRGVVTEHVPPLAFAIITLISTFIITGSWRVLYVKARGDESDEVRRGGILDGFRMVTTLLRRW